MRPVLVSGEMLAGGSKEEIGQSAALQPSAWSTVLFWLGIQRWALLFRSKLSAMRCTEVTTAQDRMHFLFRRQRDTALKKPRRAKITASSGNRSSLRKVAFQRDFDWSVTFEGTGMQLSRISSRGLAANHRRGRDMGPASCDRNAGNGEKRWKRRPHGGEPARPRGIYLLVKWLMGSPWRILSWV